MADLPEVSLYAIPASHPCFAVEEQLKLKQLPYKVVELPMFVSKLHQKVVFGRSTVPAIKVNGVRVVGSHEIPHVLDSLVPEPRLFPADPADRARIEEIDQWGDDVLQSIARHVSLAAAASDPVVAMSYQQGAKFAVPAPIAKTLGPTIVGVYKKTLGASDDQVRTDIAQLPEALNKVDAWINEGLLGQATPNAADLQIGSSIALLQTVEDLAPIFAGHCAVKLGERFRKYNKGHAPTGSLPPEWLAVATPVS